MFTYIVRRFLQMIPILILISILSFLLLRLAGQISGISNHVQSSNQIVGSLLRKITWALWIKRGNQDPDAAIFQLVKQLSKEMRILSNLYQTETAFNTIMLFLPNSLILMGLFRGWWP